MRDLRNLLVRAIITGFGLRIGSEIAKYVAHKVLPKDDSKGDEDDDEIESTSSEPPEV